MALLKDLCLFVKMHRANEPMLIGILRASTISLRLQCIRSFCRRALGERRRIKALIKLRMVRKPSLLIVAGSIYVACITVSVHYMVALICP